MDTDIGKNLKTLREHGGFTQDQVAGFLGLKRSTYSNYELGDREIPLEVLDKCTNLYGCDLNTLFEANEFAQIDSLTGAFRVDSIDPEDLKVIAEFKSIAKNYLKLQTLLER